MLANNNKGLSQRKKEKKNENTKTNTAPSKQYQQKSDYAGRFESISNFQKKREILLPNFLLRKGSKAKKC